MRLILDPSSPLPLYYQICELLRGQILSGTRKPGDALPGETQICQETGVSRMTARQALIKLANEGLVVRQRGRGTFVAPSKTVIPNVQVSGMSYTEIMERVGMIAGAQILAQEVFLAPVEIAEQLKLSLGDQIILIRRTRLASGEIMSLETSYLPAQALP